MFEQPESHWWWILLRLSKLHLLMLTTILLWTTLTKTPRQHNEMQVVVYHFTLKYIWNRSKLLINFHNNALETYSHGWFKVDRWFWLQDYLPTLRYALFCVLCGFIREWVRNTWSHTGKLKYEINTASTLNFGVSLFTATVKNHFKILRELKSSGFPKSWNFSLKSSNFLLY